MKIPAINNKIKAYSKTDPIELLQLPKPMEYALKKRNISTIGKFYKFRRKKLYKIKNLGKKSVSYLMKIKRTIKFKPVIIEIEQFKPFVRDPYFVVPPVLKSKKRVQKQTTYPIFKEINLPVFLKGSDDISMLNLPTRVENSLRNYGIESIGQFCDYEQKDLFKIRNVGYKSRDYLLQIRKKLGMGPNPILNKDVDSLTPNSEQKESFGHILNGTILTGNESIVLLDLPTRIENALINGGVETVKMFYECSSKDLLHLRNLGPNSIELLKKVKDTIVPFGQTEQEQIEIKVEQEKITQKQELEIPNELLIDMLIKRCKNTRMMEIVKRRYGLINGDRDTLEEIGKKFGVTRERIRQIQVKAIRKMRHPSVFERKLIVEIVLKILWNRDGLVSAEEADQLMPKFFKNFPYDGSSVLDLLADLGWIDVHNVGDVFFYSPKIINLELSSLMSEVVNFLKRNKILMNPESLAENFPNAKIDHDKLVKIILRCCELDPRIEEGAEGKFTSYLTNGSRKGLWISFMTQVLEEEGFPLHFTEIASRVNDLLHSRGKHLEQRRTHFLLIETSVFAQTGARGMYGLTKWGIRKESTMELAKEYIKKAGFPVHWEQIYLYVSKYKDTKKGNIRTLLDTSGKFVKKGNGFYSIKSKF